MPFRIINRTKHFPKAHNSNKLSSFKCSLPSLQQVIKYKSLPYYSSVVPFDCLSISSMAGAISVIHHLTTLTPPIKYDTYLGPEVGGWAHILVLSFRCAPGMVHLETLITVAGLAVHTALSSFLMLRRLADITHDGDGRTCRLAVALDYVLQGEVPEEHTDATLAEVDVVLAAGARDGGYSGGHRPSPPSRGRDGAWRGAKEERC